MEDLTNTNVVFLDEKFNLYEEFLPTRKSDEVNTVELQMGSYVDQSDLKLGRYLRHAPHKNSDNVKAALSNSPLKRITKRNTSSKQKIINEKNDLQIDSIRDKNEANGMSEELNPQRFIEVYLEENLDETKLKSKRATLQLRESLRILEDIFLIFSQPDPSRIQLTKYVSIMGKQVANARESGGIVLDLLCDRNKKLERIVNDLIMERNFSSKAAQIKKDGENKIKSFIEIIKQKEELLKEQDNLIHNLKYRLEANEKIMIEFVDEKNDLMGEIKIRTDHMIEQRERINELERLLKEKENLKDEDKIEIINKRYEKKLADAKEISKNLKHLKKESEGYDIKISTIKNGLHQELNKLSQKTRETFKAKNEEIETLKMMLEASKKEKSTKEHENQKLKQRLEMMSSKLPSI